MNLPAATQDRRIWLRVGTLLDGVSGSPQHSVDVVYDQQEFLFVGETSPPRHLLNENQREPDLTLPDHTLLPCLIDAHTHLFLEGGELDPHKRAAYLQQSPAQLLDCARDRLEKLVRLGIAGMRDAGDKDGVGLALSRLYSSERRPLMPYVDSPGAAIHRQGRYGGFMADPVENCDSPEQCVQTRVEAGAHRIKLIATGIINFKKGAVTAAPQMTGEEIRAFVAAAASSGKQTFAHASGDAGIQAAIDGGVDSVEHGFFVRPDQLLQMRERQIGWVPTFAPVQKQIDHADRMGWDEQTIGHLHRILDQHAASLRHAHETGVLILAGSDAGSYGVAHGIGLFDELEAMERAGLPPLTVINAATGAPSSRLAFREKFGQIRPGFLPRFLLTRSSPLDGIANLRQEKTVVFDGQVVGPSETESGQPFDARGL
jgi:imidazolonepropionase-like amidohydrolase